MLDSRGWTRHEGHGKVRASVRATVMVEGEGEGEDDGDGDGDSEGEGEGEWSA